MTNILSWRALPLFSCFFLWSLGTGAMHVARPLFAASFGVSYVLVTLVVASNAVAHLVAGPITGFAMDRWGRKPLLIMGNALRGLSALALFFANSYEQFLLFEFLGGLGVSMFTTGSSIILADLSVTENRGRAVAARSMSSRLGFVLGPALGAALAMVWDLRVIFLFNAATKVVIIAIVAWLIRETRPERVSVERASEGPSQLTLSMFLNRRFFMLSLVAFTFSMVNVGIFQSLFPVHLKDAVGLSTADVGNLISVAAFATFVVTYPNGWLVDRYGRKLSLVPGMLLLALGAYLMGMSASSAMVLLSVVVYGLAEGVCFGSTQAYAMDLAPEQRRGSFLGIWSVISSGSGFLAPLVVGFTAERLGFETTCVLVGAALALVAIAMGLFGPDTRARRRRAALATAT
jgi:MFS family permease